MNFPTMDEAFRVARLAPPSGQVRMVLDTDTYNEIDDQFAVVQALLSPERLRVEALYAAPFFNDRSRGPADGMEKSYQEILRLLERLGRPAEGLVHRGSTAYLAGPQEPQSSPAAEDLVRRALAGGKDPLYVVAIGAITNVASAILLEPRILEKIVIVWLGGHALSWQHTREFNLQQDLYASRLIFDCGVPLVQMPCIPVTTHLTTTVPEIEHHVRGRGPVGDYLADIFADYCKDRSPWAKELWDMIAVSWLLNPEWVPTVLVHSPVLTDNFTWSRDDSRHLIRTARSLSRDAILGDFFRKLAAFARAACPP